MSLKTVMMAFPHAPLFTLSRSNSCDFSSLSIHITLSHVFILNFSSRLIFSLWEFSGDRSFFLPWKFLRLTFYGAKEKIKLIATFKKINIRKNKMYCNKSIHSIPYQKISVFHIPLVKCKYFAGCLKLTRWSSTI